MPKVVVPAVNVTVPLGVAVPAVWLTVAVKVTDWPLMEVAGEAANAVADAVVPVTVTVVCLLLGA